MKRIAQATNTQNDDAVEQSVMLSPRTLLTGPRQIVRLERQYRSLSEDLQNALENLIRTKDSYVSALQTFEQAEEYIRQLGPKVKMAIMLLNSARTNPQYLERAKAEIEGIVSGAAASEPVQKTGSDNSSILKVAQTSTALADAAQMEFNTQAQPGMVPSSTTTQAPQQPEMFAQQIISLQTQLSTFTNEMYKRYNIHKKRAAMMEGQYNMSKSAYAKIRTNFFQMQAEISSLSANLSGWSERLSEYYAPSGGEV